MSPLRRAAAPLLIAAALAGCASTITATTWEEAKAACIKIGLPADGCRCTYDDLAAHVSFDRYKRLARIIHQGPRVGISEAR